MDIHALFSLKAVSYTHLDVYKRQGESHTLLAPCKRPAASYKALQCLLFIGVDGQNAEGVGKQPFHAFMGRRDPT